MTNEAQQELVPETKISLTALRGPEAMCRGDSSGVVETGTKLGKEGGQAHQKSREDMDRARL
jgi:hypothetical protein